MCKQGETKSCLGRRHIFGHQKTLRIFPFFKLLGILSSYWLLYTLPYYSYISKLQYLSWTLWSILTLTYAIGRSMLHAKNLLKTFRAEASATAVYVRSRVTTRHLPKGTTLYHICYGQKSNMEHLHKFGYQCWYKEKMWYQETRLQSSWGYYDWLPPE